ncbi:hypothetical protein D3C84_939920 [compost metagenome]
MGGRFNAHARYFHRRCRLIESGAPIAFVIGTFGSNAIGMCSTRLQSGMRILRIGDGNDSAVYFQLVFRCTGYFRPADRQLILRRRSCANGRYRQLGLACNQTAPYPIASSTLSSYPNSVARVRSQFRFGIAR